MSVLEIGKMLLSPKPAKTKKAKKQKKSLLVTLADKILQIPIGALERKWNDDQWKPDF